MAFADRMKDAKRSVEKAIDPWHDPLKRYVADHEMISTSALLDFLKAGHTTSNARRLAPLMRSFGFIPIMSRRMQPGGFRDTVCRGWTRPVRSEK